MFAVLTRMRKPNAERYRARSRDSSASSPRSRRWTSIATARAPDAPRRRRAEGAARRRSRSLPRERRLSDLRGPHRRQPARDAHRAARCRAEPALRVPLAVRRARRARRAVRARRASTTGLQEDPAGGYHDHALFREALRTRLLDTFEDEIRDRQRPRRRDALRASSSTATSPTSASG